VSKSYSLAELAGIFGVPLAGDGGTRITGVADLKSAMPGCISFLNNSRYKSLLSATRAGAVILAQQDAAACPVPALISDNPYALYAKVATLLHPDEDLQSPAGIHASAVIAESAHIDATAIIGPLAVIDENVRVGARSYIGPGSVLGKRTVVGEDCKLAANVTVYHDCKIGSRVIVHASAVIGSDGFGFAPEGEAWLKIPQLGAVTIGDDVEIGAGVAIDRGTLNDTIIENGVKLDNQIHVAHNVRIGAHTAMAAQSGVAGSTHIGRHCAIGGAVGIVGHLQIADGTRLHAFATVSQSIMESGEYASGTPLEPAAQWRRNWARFKQLDDMAKRIRQLEAKLENLEDDNNA
jgi:UDP-3-O-[3-hydroxymyristoyl] glucosamine N-acyltransferase